MFKRNIKKIRDFLKVELQRDRYTKFNRHNYTTMGNYFPLDVVTVGNMSYGTVNAHYYKTENEHLTIGSYCSIANDVHFFLGGGHDYRNILTFPLKNYISSNSIKESISKGPIEVCDDVWIGYGAVILSGVTIGKGAVIGARSVVAKDVPPYAIYAGNRVVGYRFPQEIIEKLTKLDYSKLQMGTIEEHLDLFYSHLTLDNVDEFIEAMGLNYYE